MDVIEVGSGGSPPGGGGRMIEMIRARVAAAQPAGGPKYQVLRNAILAAISSGDWTPGERLPTEAELSKLVPYSLGTVQKAYGQLVKDGLIVRTRGRGSFVASLHRQMSEPWHCRFLDDDGNVLPIYPRITGHATAGRDRRWGELFGPRAHVVQIDRAVSVNDEFEVFIRFYAPRIIATPLLKLPRKNVETANFKTVILRELGMPITRIVQTVSIADEGLWRAHGLAGAPHIVVHATGYTVERKAVYFQEIFIPRNPRRLLFESDYRP
jgi:GntR family transcriptional regulator